VSFFEENGLLLYMKRQVTSIKRRIFNLFISGRLNNPAKLKIHSTARLTGLKYMRIGAKFSGGEYCKIEAISRYGGQRFKPLIVIKDNVTVLDFVHIAANNYVEIGNNVLIAAKAYITDHNHGVYSGEGQSAPSEPPGQRVLTEGKSVIIHDNVWIGEPVSVMPGVTIGEGSVIGANSVVTKDIPPFTIAVGTPARAIKKFDNSSRKWVPV
jgi:acetyltransferase-like isoleucine patch superfamily enzyme